MEKKFEELEEFYKQAQEKLNLIQSKMETLVKIEGHHSEVQPVLNQMTNLRDSIEKTEVEQNQLIEENKKKLKEENYSLKDENAKLEYRIRHLSKILGEIKNLN